LLLYQGMGYKEISDILKISTDAVGSHLYEARRRHQLALRQHEREGAG
jgi:DNA-directed RNA polymerase specialized sigma24 family protein